MLNDITRIALLVTTLALALARPALAAAPLQAQRSLTDAPAPEAEGRRRPFDTVRAGLDMAALMGLGVAWYESQIELNKLDFDFDRTWADQWRRIGTGAGIRFDDNNPTLNVGHAFVGAYYHQLARSNGGGMLAAMAFDLATSSTWELTVEHREVFSLNDTAMTGLGGVAMGESLYQLGEYFGRSRLTVRNALLMGLFAPARALGVLQGDRLHPSAAGFDQHGLAADAQHRFALALGGGRPLGEGSAGWEGDLGLDLELVNLPSYGRAGQRDRSLGGGDFTRMTFAYAGGASDLHALSLAARSSLWGRYRQDTTADEDAGRTPDGRPASLHGSASFVGLATAFALEVDEHQPVTDWVAAAHLCGPTADVTLYRGRATVRLASDLYPDFALVRPLALDERTPAEALAGSKSTLAGDQYYYAWGVTTAHRLEASYGGLRAGLGAAFSYFDSIEGLDRHQRAYVSPTGVPHPAITNDVELHDQRLDLRLYSESPLPLTDVKLGLSLDYQRRAGAMGELERTRRDLRLGVHATYAM